MIIVYLMQNKDSNESRVVLVTGGLRGIGRATGDVLRSERWTVILADRDRADQESRAKFDCRLIDVADTASVDEVIAAVGRDHGRLDGLVNAAGFNKHQPVDSLEDETFRTLFDVHLGGVLRTSRAAAPLLKASSGAVVNFSSIAGRVGRSKRAPYSAAKAGTEALTRTMAIEWASWGVRVNCVVPGIVDTRLVRQNIEHGLVDRDRLISSIPLGRMGQPEELANVIAFLLSDKASFITGQSIVVDGGSLANGDW
jgi:3-oxoacyl-[acyl-carrier protein] reductase